MPEGRSGAAPLLHSTWLLIRLRLRRLANLLAAGSQGRKKPGERKRTGNPGKKSSKIVLYVAWPMMLFMFGAITANSVMNLHGALDPPGAFWVTVEFSTALTIGVAFLLFVLWLSSLLVTVGSGELARPEWDLEWLITLPIRADTLLWARLAERSIVNPSGAIALIPACAAIAWFSGLRWSAPLVGVLAAWPLLLLAALVRTLIDTGLRLRMRRRSCAICTPSSPCCRSSRCISRSPSGSRASRNSCWASRRRCPTGCSTRRWASRARHQRAQRGRRGLLALALLAEVACSSGWRAAAAASAQERRGGRRRTRCRAQDRQQPAARTRCRRPAEPERRATARTGAAAP
jgi:hypothetical protein